MLTNPSPRRPSSPNAPARPSGPANDNRRLRIIVPTSPRRLARYGGNLLKLNPYLRLLGDALNILDLLQQYQGEGWEGLGAWSKYCECAAPNPVYSGPWARQTASSVYQSGTVKGLVTGCQAGQAILPETLGNPWNGVANSARSVGIGRTVIISGSYRMQYQEGYTRPNTGAFPLPQYKDPRAAIALPPPVPQTWPLSVFPELAAPLQAPAFPPPRPRSMPAGVRSVNSAASYGTEPRRAVAPASNSSSVPNDWAVSIELGPAVKGAPTTHTLAPPTGAGKPSRERTKEAKVKISPAFAVVLKAVGMGTEAIDIVNAIYEALPREYRPKFRGTDQELRSATLLQKMQALYDHADKIVLDDALRNLLTEQVEDAFYGKIGKVGGEISKRLGINYGAGMNSIASRLRKLTYDSERNDVDNPEGMGER